MAELNTPMYILLQNGLSNRLRTLVGFWYIADKTNRSIIFHWDTKDQACNGLWSDIYESLTSVAGPNIHLFDTHKLSTITYDFIGHNTISETIKKFAPQLIKNGNIAELITAIEDTYYPRLRPKKYILDEVDRFFQVNNKPGNVIDIAIHIRRTDHSELAKQNNSYTTFEEFDEFIAANKNKKIFLATDNLDVQKKYANCLVYKPITKSKSCRQTPLTNALIDILIAARCSKFKGSGYSSFSGLIQIYNRAYSRKNLNI